MLAQELRGHLDGFDDGPVWVLVESTLGVSAPEYFWECSPSTIVVTISDYGTILRVELAAELASRKGWE